MHLKLKNIGVLKNADIDLSKDLIVLCGHNNTGKTYATYSVYGFFRILNDIELKLDYSDNEISEIFSKFTINIDLYEYFLKIEDKVINEISSTINHLIKDIFASKEEFFSKSEIKLEFNRDILEKKIFESVIEQKIIINKRQKEVLYFYKSEKSRVMTAYYTVYEDSLETKRFLIKKIEENILKIIINLFFNSIYIAPAERLAINLFNKEISIRRNSLFSNPLFSNFEEKKNIINENKRYSIPIVDSLYVAEDLENLQKNKSDFSYIADMIEVEILKGKIDISSHGEMQFNPNESKKSHLGIHLTGSVVKSLSSIVFYFRHLAKKNDFIIIDEPELNLHPDNQRIIAKIIAKIVNNGFKVMISTHSDYIIRELNNLIMLKSGKEKSTKLLEKYNYKNEELLDYNNVGVYFFDKNKANKIKVDKTGFEINSIDKEIISLNESSEDIYFSLF
ncbi:MAG: AAA family ATPase [Cyanobacteriota bacterium]